MWHCSVASDSDTSSISSDCTPAVTYTLQHQQLSQPSTTLCQQYSSRLVPSDVAHLHMHSLGHKPCAQLTCSLHVLRLRLFHLTLSWTIPSNIPVSAFGGQSLFGLFTASIGEELAKFPQGPSIDDPFW